MSDGERRIAAAFDTARSEGRAALMPYVMGCFPDEPTASAVARAYADAGADLVEVGVPYSDPLADGPVIHAAATAALANGASFERSIAVCEAFGDGVPAIVMCYANMVQAMGARRFAGRLADAGAAGAIVPDLPLEEAGETRDALADEGLALAPLVAPTTPDDRRREICASARGFVYVVSLVGVTGERESLPSELEARAHRAELISARESRMNEPTARAADSASSASPTSRTSRLATITPSAMRPTSATCAGVEIPKPTATGTSASARAEATFASSSLGRLSRSPVTPTSETT